MYGFWTPDAADERTGRRFGQEALALLWIVVSRILRRVRVEAFSRITSGERGPVIPGRVVHEAERFLTVLIGRPNSVFGHALVHLLPTPSIPPVCSARRQARESGKVPRWRLARPVHRWIAKPRCSIPTIDTQCSGLQALITTSGGATG